MAPLQIRRIARISGRVQGVGFRWATRARAEEFGVHGTVRNLLDGTVEADAEGDATAVDALLAWLHDGPRTAAVDAVEVSEARPRGTQGFTITD